MDETSISTRFGNLSIFNSGVRDGEYHYDMTAWIKDRLATGTLTGTVSASSVAPCAGEVMVVNESTDYAADPTLHTIVADGNVLRSELRKKIDLPGRRRMLETAGLACVDATAYLVKSHRRSLYVGRLDSPKGTTWRRVDMSTGDLAGVTVCGVLGRTVVLFDNYSARLWSLDLETADLAIRGLARPHAAPGGSVTCTVTGGAALVYADQTAGDPLLVWYDAEGTAIKELAIRGLADYLAEAAEFVTSKPVPLP